jgi:putative N6-adenine-specific DNA methylase
MTDGPDHRARSSARRHRIAVVCTPGLELWCRQELIGLGLKPKPAGPGLFEADATTRQLYAANVWLRTAARVVVRAGTFRATDFAHLQAGAADIDWSIWLPSGIAPKFRVSANDSKLYHTDAVAQRLHQVVGPSSVGEPEQLVVVRIERNTVTISIDSSGPALHHRPWRLALAPAPLRTTMAAAALLATGWDGSVPLIDPFCGAGTIPIEAALLALGLPPSGRRAFAFHDWPSFEAGTWASVTASEPAVGAPGGTMPRIVGSDRDNELVRAAEANAERAGVGDHVRFETVVVSQLKAADGAGLVLTNPPFGKRVGEGRLDGLYRRFGAVVNQRLAGHDLAVVSPDRKLVGLADRRLRSLAHFRHGGLPVDLYHRAAAPAEGADDVPTGSEPGSRLT